MTDPLVRFFEKVDFGPTDDDCWEWTAGKVGHGYGRFLVARKLWLAHRWIYEQLVGPIPEGLQIDHLCRIYGCVNPRHLEVVTGQENRIRGALAAPKKVFCIHGHVMSEANAYEPPGTLTQRRCRECQRLRDKAFQKAKRARLRREREQARGVAA